MEDCIFCTLAKDPEQTSLVYQDGLVYACMDIAPVNPGHVLVVPQKHSNNFTEMSEYDFLHIMKIAKQISLKMKKEIDCHCIALYAYEGIPHTHIHLIPSREEKDVCTRRVWEDRWEEADKCDLDSMADRLRME